MSRMRSATGARSAAGTKFGTAVAWKCRARIAESKGSASSCSCELPALSAEARPGKPAEAGGVGGPATSAELAASGAGGATKRHS
eukprot:6495666-Alexandrium_andersonii.AAC.1